RELLPVQVERLSEEAIEVGVGRLVRRHVEPAHLALIERHFALRPSRGARREPRRAERDRPRRHVALFDRPDEDVPVLLDDDPRARRERGRDEEGRKERGAREAAHLVPPPVWDGVVWSSVSFVQPKARHSLSTTIASSRCSRARASEDVSAKTPKEPMSA